MNILLLRWFRMLFTGCVIAFFFSHAYASTTAPAQPTTGPGGSTLPHQAVSMFTYGQGAQQYWLYEPASPAPATAPVIVFLHGWGAINTKMYGAWIDHLVRRGNIVIYPRWQETALTPAKEYTPNVVASLIDAFSRLQNNPDHVRPQIEHIAAVGHSVGGLLAANLAANAIDAGLPPIKAVMSIEPGRTWNKPPMTSTALADLKKIPETTLLISMAGDADEFVGDRDAITIYKKSTRIPVENKNLVLLVSDSHATPELKADHYAPAASDSHYDNHLQPLVFGDTSGAGAGSHRAAKTNLKQPVTIRHQTAPAWDTNAHDWYGIWKLFDALCDTAFYGTNRAYALGNTPEQRFMGTWSDGVPVKELHIVDKP